MNKVGCVLELMVGKLWFGEQAGGKLVQQEQLNELVKLGFFYYANSKNKEAIKYFSEIEKHLGEILSWKTSEALDALDKYTKLAMSLEVSDKWKKVSRALSYMRKVLDELEFV